MKFDLFKPGMFSKRASEVEAIEKCLFQTKHGNPQNFLIQGEKGTGKSSLILYAKYLATGQLKNTYKFSVIKVELEPNLNLLDIVEKLILEAKTEFNSNSIFENVKTQAIEILSSFQSSHLSFNNNKTSNTMLISDVADTFKKISELNKIDGVLVLIDEADKPSPQAGLGSFFKLLIERLSTIDCHSVCLGVSGLPETMEKLKENHESSLRLFRILNLKPLSINKTKHVIETKITDANKALLK